MSRTHRLHILKSMPDALTAFMKVEELIGQSELDARLRHLIKLRASQINGCIYCINMHLKEARQDGETQSRLDQLIVWRQTDLFTPAEKAALDWTEALTTGGTNRNLDPLHSRLSEHFTHDQIDALTPAIIMINSWNRMQIANHNMTF